MELIKIDRDGKEIKIEQSELNNPEHDNQEKTSLLAHSLKSNLFRGADFKGVKEIDTDNDAIPDEWEINGYTIINKKAVKDIDKTNHKSTSSCLSKCKCQHRRYVSFIKSEYGSTKGAEINAGYSTLQGFYCGVSVSYSHSETVGTEWGDSKSLGTSFNSASASYFNSNVRYKNVGKGTIYEVKPTINFILNKKTFATITAKQNTTALEIKSGESYPKKGLSPILLNSMDDFNSSYGFQLNSEQTKSIVQGEAVKIETTQTDGK